MRIKIAFEKQRRQCLRIQQLHAYKLAIDQQINLTNTYMIQIEYSPYFTQIDMHITRNGNELIVTINLFHDSHGSIHCDTVGYLSDRSLPPIPLSDVEQARARSLDAH